MKKLALALAFSALFAAESFGVDAVWKNTETTAQDWMTASNWKDAATGEELTEPPTNATDTATFPDIDTTTRTVNVFPKNVNVSWSLDELSGTSQWLMLLYGGSHAYGRYTRSLTVADVNDYAGEWKSEGTKQTLRLVAESGEQNLATVWPNYQFPIEVANAGVTAVIDRVRGTKGALTKEGAGTLRVKTVYDAPLQLQINAGEVQIDGVIGDDAPVFSKAIVRLDASKVDSLLGYEDDKGRMRVTNWLNCAEGGTIDAEWWDNSGSQTKSYVKHIGVPFLAKSASGTGLPMLDFGYIKGTTSTPDENLPYTDEPTNCVLRFTSRMTDIREVFAVFDHPDGRGDTVGVFGDSTDYAFACNQHDCFKHADAYPAVFDGEVLYNNSGIRKLPGADNKIDWPFDQYSPRWSDMTLLNLKAAGDLNIHYLATDRLYKGSSGGMRIGEVILFTNNLTSAERRDISEYLMKKWFGAYPQKEFKLVHAADGVALSVPAGRTAKVDTVSARGALIKRGAGTLEISHLYPADTKITVEDGAVRFIDDKPTVSTDGPAGTPQFWYDADAENPFETDGESVTAWHDCRSEYSTSRQAVKYNDGKVTEYPVVDTETLPGHTVLDFPPAAAMTMPGSLGGSYVFQREVLMVFTFKTATAAKTYNHIGAGGYTSDRGAYAFYNPASADDKIGGGVYTINGVATDPFRPDDGTTFKPGTWYVVSAAFTGTMSVNRIGSDSARNKLGNIKVGEVITYDKALTDDERRNTIAYLMKKWLGKDHPSVAVEPTPVMEFPADAPAVISADGDQTYQSVVGGNGELVKVGTGSATIEATLADGFADIAVASGDLVITKPTGPVDSSSFHFDASDASTFEEYYIDANGETNVQKIVDVRRNGVTASTPAPFSPSSGNMFYVTNPIVRFAEFAPGVRRPYFDCLTYTGRNIDPPTGAGFYVSPYPKATATKEVHAVMATHSAVDVFWGRSNVDFKRGLNNRLFRNTGESAAASPDVLDGYISVDNAVTNYSFVLKNDTFHLISLAPLSGKDVATIGIDRNNNSGGPCFAEIVAFSDYLSAKERAFLQDKLMYKWFGKGQSPVWENELTSVSVAKDATLTVSGGAIQAPTVTGGGTIEATRVSGIAALNLKATDRTTVEGLTVEGVADFAGAVAVNLSGADAAKLKAGKYALVTATSFANLDLAQWTLTTQLKNGYRFVLEGNTVFLAVQPNGMLFIVR